MIRSMMHLYIKKAHDALNLYETAFGTKVRFTVPMKTVSEM